MVVLVEEALADIGMKSINVVNNLECDGKASWVVSVLEVWKNPKYVSMDRLAN